MTPQAVDSPRARSERLLEQLGLPVEPGPDLELLQRLLEGLVTRTGSLRWERLANCGVAFPAITVDGKLTWERRGCRDRFCPTCSQQRSRELAGQLRDHWQGRVDRGRAGLFITLTQVKVAGESARDALQRLLASWRTVANARNEVSDGIFRWGRVRKGQPAALLPGGMRSVEITARHRGDVIQTRNGPREIEVGGIHAHLHCLAELAPGVRHSHAEQRLLAAWTAASEGSALIAQKIELLDSERIYQACKYPVDMAALAKLVDVAPSYAREVVNALHGRQVVATWGSWRGVLRHGGDGTGIRFGDRSLLACVMRLGAIVDFGVDQRQAGQVLAEIAGAASYRTIRRQYKADALEFMRAAGAR